VNPELNGLGFLFLDLI